MKAEVISSVSIVRIQPSNKINLNWIIPTVMILHLIGLLTFILDYYFLDIYISNYNDGLVPDQQMFILRGESVLHGNLPYEGIESYESIAPPISMYALSLPIVIHFILPLPMHILYRLYFSTFNILTTFLLVKIGEKHFSGNSKYYPGLLFGCNPYIISQASITGSDECLGAFLMILTVYFISNHNDLGVVTTIGIGTSIKYYPILLIPYYASTKKEIKGKIIFTFLSILFVALFFIPFYFVNQENFMVQFNNRVKGLPWNSEGNSGIVILIARLNYFNFADHSLNYRIIWMSIIAILGAIQSFYLDDKVENSYLIPSVFFILYPKFFFSYFVIVFPLLSLSIISLKYFLREYFLINFGLIIGGSVNDRVLGFGSIYRQIPGRVPILMVLGILFFYISWISIDFKLWKKSVKLTKNTNSISC